MKSNYLYMMTFYFFLFFFSLLKSRVKNTNYVDVGICKAEKTNA